MDLSADQRLAEVPAVQEVVRRQLVVGVRMVVEESAVLRLKMGWAR